MRIIHVKYGPDALTALLASGYATLLNATMKQR